MGYWQRAARAVGCSGPIKPIAMGVVMLENRGRETGKSDGFSARSTLDDKLWQAADKLRGHVDSAEYKHLVLGLVFLKYISDAFQERHDTLVAEGCSDPEDRSAYITIGIFWVPKEARWSQLQASAGNPNIGKLIDSAMAAIERANSQLKGVLPRIYSRPSLDKQRLGDLVKLIGEIGLGDWASRSMDVLGRVYEYFLGRFATTEGKGGEFYTPQCVVRLLVQMIEPDRGIVYDPCCGTGGMFVQSEKFAVAHGGKASDLSVTGQELNPTTWRLCKMNLAIRDIEGDVGSQAADTFHNDLHPELKADYILANPPFNVSDWGGERLRFDVRWKYGVPPTSSANYAWVQHILHHLAPSGIAGFVLTNGSLSASEDRGEGSIRKALVEADLIDCIVALPDQLFFNTQIAACLWFLAPSKSGFRYRDRRGTTLFIYAQTLGRMVDRTHRELAEEDISQIADSYHAWRSKDGANRYRDIPGFCKSVSREEILAHRSALVPGRYVGFNRRSAVHWDNVHLMAELAEVENRLDEIARTSDASINILKELLHG